MTNVSVYIYIDKHNTTWKVLCTVFTHSFLYQELTRLLRSLVPYARTFHEVFNIYIVPLPRVFWILLQEFWLMMIESFNGHRGITLT